MKRVAAFFLIFSILLLCAACQAPSEDPQEAPQNTQPPLSGLPDSDIQNPSTHTENLYAISVPTSSQQTRSDDGTVVFEYVEPVMYLTVPDMDVADKIIIDFLTRIDNARSEADSLHAQALSDYDGDAEWIPYTYQLNYSPTRLDQGVLSLVGEALLFNGGPHSDRNLVSANYDMLTGDVLTLGSILYHLDTKDDLCRIVIEKLDALRDTTYLYDYYSEAVTDHFNQDESHLECFYFTEDALCFYFAPYELAPYSSGIITVSIPYSELTGIIGDQFFPAEQQVTVGNVSAHLFSEVDLEQYQQFAELTTDPNGEKIIISTDGIIQNVRIHSGIWNEDGTSFLTQSTLFCANALSSTDAIMLETDIPDVLPELMLTFKSNGTVFSYYIFQSGKDGSIILEPTN